MNTRRIQIPAINAHRLISAVKGFPKSRFFRNALFTPRPKIYAVEGTSRSGSTGYAQRDSIAHAQYDAIAPVPGTIHAYRGSLIIARRNCTIYARRGSTALNTDAQDAPNTVTPSTD